MRILFKFYFFFIFKIYKVNKFDKRCIILKNKLKFLFDILEIVILFIFSGRIVVLFLFYCWLGIGNFWEVFMLK